MSVAASHHDITRRYANYTPSVWGNIFLQYASQSLEVDEEMGKQIETLKDEVRMMLISMIKKPLTKVELIDSLQCLGLSYHFELEIDEVLQQIYNNYIENNEMTHTEDLNSLALLFKLLRQQGYPISPDEQANFSKTLTLDVQGMPSLYEVAHLSFHGEDSLDKALAFTSNHLQSITIESNSFLVAKLHHNLKQCPYRGLPRLEAQKYMSIYHLHPSCNQVLLTMARLDFNVLQKLHQKEVGSICKWWDNLDVPRNLSYARDRIVECCFWIIRVYFEPQYSKARKIMAKVIGMLSIIDDTYDACGTISELELLTVAIERWDICCLDNLPKYMKLPYKELLNVFEEIDQDMRKEGRSYGVPYAKQEFKNVVQAYNMTEARWFNRNHIPKTKEYLDIATISCCYPLLATNFFIGMGDIVTEDIFKWAQTHPKIIKASSVICRLMDDIVSSELEKKRGHVATLAECYAKEHGVSRQEATDEFEKIIGIWKDINQECLKPTQVPKPFLKHGCDL